MTSGLSRDRAALLVVDIQERLAAVMQPAVLEQVVRNTVVLIETANRLGLPIAVSQQYPKGLGATVPAIEEALRAVTTPAGWPGGDRVYRFDKTVFAATASEQFAGATRDPLQRDQWIVAGMEAHICVYQTARGLVTRGLQAHVVSDAVCSRTKANWKIGCKLVERLGDARGLDATAPVGGGGAVLTSTEVVVFDLLGRAGTDDFKALSRLIK
ncbi:MAG TPA: isochorismatase family protein [Kofleriaceae bacterium]|nr:isochorismatase family protein [Kofleriaceae bacterium]